ncbi:MAG: SdpI family protein [Planctomycetales bacterium]
MRNRDVWVRTNRRVFIMVGMIPLAFGTLGSLLIGLAAVISVSVPLQALGWILAVGSTLTLGPLIYAAAAPRVGRSNDSLLLYLSFGPPLEVPVSCVDCFLMGRGRLLDDPSRDDEAHDLIVRLKPKQRRRKLPPDVELAAHPWLASWDENGVHLRGAWCEPLSVCLVNRLNEQLYQAIQDAKAKPKAKTP